VERRRESFNVEEMSRRGSDDPEFAAPWKATLSELEAMYTLARPTTFPSSS